VIQNASFRAYQAAGVPVPPPHALKWNRAGDAGRMKILRAANCPAYYHGTYYRKLPPHIAAAIENLHTSRHAA
jgi:hypothetical protein